MSLNVIFTDNDIQQFRSNFETISKGPGNKYGSLAILFFSIAIFYASGALSTNPIDIVILMGVLLFHELGHLAFMKLFGYADLRVFFIPFLGAAAMGKHDSASQVKKAVVSLMGPLPGIVLSVVLFESISEKNSHVVQAITTLLFLNIFNLLPLMPLDGGRLVHELFSGNIVWSTVFSVISGALLALLAIQAQTWELLIIVVFVFIGQYSIVQYDKISKIAELPKEGLRSLTSILALSNQNLNLILSSFKMSFRRAFEPKLRYNVVYKHLENLADHNNHTPSKFGARILLFIFYIILLLTALIYIGRVNPVLQGAASKPKINQNANQAQARVVPPIEEMQPEDYKNTIEIADKAIALNPKDEISFFKRARAKLNLKDDRGTIADATRLIELNPRPMAAFELRGNARISARDFKGAIDDYNWILMHSPDNAVIYSNRCFAKFLMNDLKSALDDCNRAKKNQPDYPAVRVNGAHVKVALKDYVGALQDVEVALKIRPGYGEAFYIRAKAKAGLKMVKDDYCSDYAYARKLGYLDVLPALTECKL